jgi:hypothetical protein
MPRGDDEEGEFEEEEQWEMIGMGALLHLVEPNLTNLAGE